MNGRFTPQPGLPGLAAQRYSARHLWRVSAINSRVTRRERRAYYPLRGKSPVNRAQDSFPSAGK